MCASGDGSAPEQGAASVRAPYPEVISVEAREQIVEVLQAKRQIQGYCVGFYINNERKQINTDFQLTQFETL